MVDCGGHGQIQLTRFKHAASCQCLYRAVSLKGVELNALFHFSFGKIESTGLVLIISHKMLQCLPRVTFDMAITRHA